MMAHTTTIQGNLAQVPELSALRTQHQELLTKSTKTRQMLEALCQVLIKAGVVSEQRLSAEIHRLSFAAVCQAHSCGRSMSLWCVFRTSDVAFNIASWFLNKRDCVSVRTASRAFATCMAQMSPAMVRPKVFVWGGDQPGRHEAVEMFDPVSNTWETFPSSVAYRVDAASVVINGRMYVCGGRSGDPFSPSASLACFDPVSGIWQILPPMSQGHYAHAAAVVGGRLYVCGGESGRAECFDTLTSSWTTLPAMLHPRDNGRAAVIKNHVYIVGGDTNRLASERLPPTGNWQEQPRMSRPRSGFATAVLVDKLYVCGGFGQASVERFVPEVGVWELLQPMSEERPCATAAVLHGQLYMCGGLGRENMPLSSTPRTTRGSGSHP